MLAFSFTGCTTTAFFMMIITNQTVILFHDKTRRLLGIIDYNYNADDDGADADDYIISR